MREVTWPLISVSHSGPASCVTLRAFSPSLVVRFEVIRRELGSVLSAKETVLAHSVMRSKCSKHSPWFIG